MGKSKYLYEKRTIIVYFITTVLLVGLSCIGLIWGDWEVIMSMGFGVVFGFLNLLSLLHSSTVLGRRGDSSTKSSIYGFAGVRQLIMLLAIGAPALIIYFTKKDTDSNLRFLNILAAGVPFIACTGIFSAVKPSDKELEEMQNRAEENNQLPPKYLSKKDNEEVEESSKLDLEYFPALQEYGFSQTSWAILTDEQKGKVLVQIAEGKIKKVSKKENE